MRPNLIAILLILSFGLFAQSNLILNFNAVDSATNLSIPLDSVIISDLSSGSDTTIYGATPSLVIMFTGTNDNFQIDGMYLSDPIPNPTSGNSEMVLVLDQYSSLVLSMYDISGAVLYSRHTQVGPGVYRLNVTTGGKELVIVSLRTNNAILSRKIITIKGGSVGNTNPSVDISRVAPSVTHPVKSAMGFGFNPGDTLLLISFASGYLPDSIISSPTVNTSYTFSLKTNPVFVCGSTLVDSRDNQLYPTVHIGTQCWMGKNLNVGMMVNSVNTGSYHSDVTNNGVIEKYCCYNDTSYCTTYGGLYEWDEAMGYDTTPGIQGVCPTGWHIPTDADWNTLETYLGGYNVAGGKMKETGYIHWPSPNTGATNSSGFTGLPGRCRNSDGSFIMSGHFGYFWSSSLYSSFDAWSRYLTYYTEEFGYQYSYRTEGYSVRCVADTFQPCLPQPDQAYAGPDSLLIIGDSIFLYANTPLSGFGQWSIIFGQGGEIADSSNATSLFTGQPGFMYSLVWAISTACDTSTDTVNISFAATQIFQECGDTLIDIRDGQNYLTVQIGTQCWMADNLNIGMMATSVNTGYEHSDVSNNGVIEKYCYNNTSNNCDTYGGLYDWDEAMGYDTISGAQGICPSGWHIPTNDEWCTLTTLLDTTVNCNIYGTSGTDVGGKLKEIGTTYWNNPNTGATNSSGFTALGAGYRHADGTFSDLKKANLLRSSSKYTTANALYWSLSYNKATIWQGNYYKVSGQSVRCLNDSIYPCSPIPDQSNAGPDSLYILGDSIQLQANTPTVGSGQWTVVSENGGVFSDLTSADSWFFGMLDSTYTLAWTISTVCGSSSDTVIVGFVATIPFICGNILIDTRDNKQYPTVQIGSQCWMKKNLNVGTMVNSTVTGSNHSDMSNDSIIEKYCYNNNPSFCSSYGGLYDWNEAMGYDTTPGIQGICPADWHIPTDAEWDILETYLGGSAVAGGKMKETGVAHWSPPNTGATNSSGFTGYPGGVRNGVGDILYPFFFGYLWSSSYSSSTNAWFRRLIYSNTTLDRTNSSKYTGASIRCIKN